MKERDRKAYKQAFPMHNISINEKCKTVRLYVEHSQRYFPFRDYGGKFGAILAAQAARDMMPAEVIHSQACSDRQRTRSSTGHKGITVYKNSNGEPVGYAAQWREGKLDKRKTKTKKFHFEKYKDALTSAAKYRKEREEENGLAEAIYVDDRHGVPIWKEEI